MRAHKTLFLFTFIILSSAVSTLAYAEVSDASASQDTLELDESLSQAELEQILAPIALYPDTLLSHILVAATYPLEIVQAERWTSDNSNLSGSAAVKAVEEFGWDPSVQALVAFPQVLKKMSEDLAWTQALGEAFLESDEKVLASVQNLRQLAADAGNLEEMDKVTISRDNDTILIEPAQREIVYIPYYDSRIVYGNWRWAHHAPIFWDYPYYDDYYAHRYGRPYSRPFYWGPGISVSFGFHLNSFHWGNRHIVRLPSRYYRSGRHYSSRQIANHRDSRRWHHNPTHRRGVGYRNRHARNNYAGGKPHRNRNNDHNNANTANRESQIRRHEVRRQPEQLRDRMDRNRNSATTNRRLERERLASRNRRLAAPRSARPSRRSERGNGVINQNTSNRNVANRPRNNRPANTQRPTSRVVQPTRQTNNRRPTAAPRQQPRSAPARPAAQPVQRQARRQQAAKQYHKAEPKSQPRRTNSTERGNRARPR